MGIECWEVEYLLKEQLFLFAVIVTYLEIKAKIHSYFHRLTGLFKCMYVK